MEIKIKTPQEYQQKKKTEYKNFLLTSEGLKDSIESYCNPDTPESTKAQALKDIYFHLETTDLKLLYPPQSKTKQEGLRCFPSDAALALSQSEKESLAILHLKCFLEAAQSELTTNDQFKALRTIIVEKIKASMREVALEEAKNFELPASLGFLGLVLMMASWSIIFLAGILLGAGLIVIAAGYSAIRYKNYQEIEKDPLLSAAAIKISSGDPDLIRTKLEEINSFDPLKKFPPKSSAETTQKEPEKYPSGNYID